MGMHHDEIKAYLLDFDGSDRMRAARHLLETNPAVRALIGVDEMGDDTAPTTRHERGGVKAMQPGYTGDSRDMKASANRPSGFKEGWRYWDRRMHPDTPDLGKCDYKAPASVGTFLPDAPTSQGHVASVCPGLAL
jgi:hypothetical protein